ncbi:cbb3-type cytochrome oxidase assembly protein CcoS [Quisquiliibacterium transsilvanicum]|uniref:Cbb3-type cytochrome oxidase maturation protein n=1 Tax=Quisquiliibacterium transsilvanicum TaxID=1549638 RepID=A0A7W8M909_9BURK|nr:cbb3-type cytochrome oxidase maturation protein [Quisquiliibacterium transsilvanicum]
MESLYLLIPLSLAIVALAVWLFFRMSDSGQFDDMEGPAHSILMDDDRPGNRGRPAPDEADGAQGAAGDTGDTGRAGRAAAVERGAEASSDSPRGRA